MNRIKTAVAVTIAAVIMVACTHLKPGADPLVVRTEQALTVAGSSFDLVLRLDNVSREFWMTNAPAYHRFCEWLRSPIAYGQTNVPRCISMQLNVDDLKLAYQAQRNAGNSNALVLVLTVLEGASLQASSWSHIVTAPVH